MEIFGWLLFLIGALISVVGGIWLLIVAFQESVLWGLGCLFVPIVSLVFVIMHWENAKTPFLVQLAAIPLVVVGLVMMPPEDRSDFLDSALPNKATIMQTLDA